MKDVGSLCRTYFFDYRLFFIYNVHIVHLLVLYMVNVSQKLRIYPLLICGKTTYDCPFVCI